MFTKILIANRGEIACRVMRTAKRMGIKTVAVYSDADRDALHVREADEAVRIGTAPSADSYLVAERIVQACLDTGAEAVHPGYGFLSERSSFAEALAAKGIAFIGPPVGAIAAMGDKIESKKLAQAAGVSTVPGHLQAIDTPDEAVQIAEAIGYPVMLKASAGGGGKGMRVCRTAAEVREGLISTQNEARTAFGDDRVFCEKFIEKPRHIEIQVLGDQHGTILYLGERECSVQRRHQKVIEEAPSPFVDEAMRRAMGEQAVALARAVGYFSAGTVEFIAGADKSFYFLEMNTRLQVEHPVTELVTGLDLVEWMIRVAAGEKLPIRQDQVQLKGWAMEARLYAEDPARGFLPSIGRVTRYIKPEGKGVRVDTGVYEGAEISMYYDPMIAKLITSGPTREAAIDTMATALDAFDVRGVAHNAAFLSALMALPRFRAGDLTTNLIAEDFPGGYVPAMPTGERLAELLGLAAVRAWAADLAPTKSTQLVVRAGGVNHPVRVTAAEGGADVVMDGWTLAVRGPLTPVTLWHGTLNGRTAAVQISRTKGGERLLHQGQAIETRAMSPRAAELMALMPEKKVADLSKFLLSPMPGLLVQLNVAAGQAVKAGDALAVVEAMKMENVLRADADGVVKAIRADKGASLAVDQVILEFA